MNTRKERGKFKNKIKTKVKIKNSKFHTINNEIWGKEMNKNKFAASNDKVCKMGCKMGQGSLAKYREPNQLFSGRPNFCF